MNFRPVNQTLAAFCTPEEDHSGHDCSEHEPDVHQVPKARPLRYFPDEILKMPCQPVQEVNSEVRQLAKDLAVTMMVEGGVGLAAPQVGRLLRVFVVDVNWTRNGAENANPHFFINPSLEPIEDLDGVGKVTSTEGCLSFPGAGAKVERFRGVRVKYTDMNGYAASMEARGLLGIAIQHEMDHLEGKTIQGLISRFDMDKTRKLIKKALRERKAQYKKR